MRGRRRGALFIWVGIILMMAAAGLGAYNLWDNARAARAADEAVEQLLHPEVPRQEAEVLPEEPPIYEANSEMEMPVETVDGWEYIGVLEFPERGLTLPVIGEWSYPALKAAPCRYEGSAYTNDLIISAHNYNAHFACLKKMDLGEPIRFTDLDGNVFSYTVAAQEVLLPTDVEGMKSGDWDLTLFTCTVGGENRVTVRCLAEETI